MRLRLETDYGIRCILYLAKQEEYVQAGKIAMEMAVPENVIPRVLSRLKRYGLVSARSGVQGGHKLGRPPEQITMLDIIRCMEDRFVMGRSEEMPKVVTADDDGIQSVHQYFMGLQELVNKSMSSVTIADLIHVRG